MLEILKGIGTFILIVIVAFIIISIALTGYDSEDDDGPQMG